MQSQKTKSTGSLNGTVKDPKLTEYLSGVYNHKRPHLLKPDNIRMSANTKIAKKQGAEE